MKLLKLLLVIALVATNVAPAFAVTEITSAPEAFLSAVSFDVSDGCTLITRTLAAGDKDAEVLMLGNFLKKQGFFNGTPSQNFNPALEKALSNYQLDKKIISNKNSKSLGITNAPTREQIADASCKKRDIATPKTSCVFLTRNLTRQNNDDRFTEENRTLQRFLVQKGYLSSTFVTGFYGNLTREAVARFQVDNGIVSSLSSAGAGEVGSRTREFIAANTCGKADVASTTDEKRIGYTVSLSTKTGVKIDSRDNEQVLSIKIKPQEQNAQLNSLTLQLESSTSTKPSDFIDSVEIYTKNKIISRTRGADIWTPVANVANNYTVRLNGASDMLSRGEEFDVTVKVTPKSSALSVTPKEFKMFVPSNGLSVQFSNLNGVVKGSETWGSPNQKSSFSIGKPAATTNTTTPVNTSATTTTPTTPAPTATTTPVVTAVAQAPQLNWVRPDTGSFGEELIVRGVNFHPTQNRIRIVHAKTGAERTTGILASKNNQITFNFPGKNAEFKLPKGKITGENGNYRIYVTSNGKESNWILYKVQAR
jgi:peptidoglycan hydrolase-like protein with peptidoglycan-binding domain